MPSQPSVCFIINPVAGRGKAKHIAEKLSAFLKSSPFPHKVLITQHPQHGTELAREASKTSDFIIAVGGDGTLNEVASALVHTNVTLAVLSEGSGNDFGRLLNAPSKVGRVTDIFLSSIHKKFDCGKVRVTFDNGGSTERYFFNSLGIGFDAAVAKQVSQISSLHAGVRHFGTQAWLRGVPLYAAALVKTLAGYRPHRFSVSSAEYNKQKSFFLVCIGNGMWEGGGFKVTPNAVPDDGKFQVCCVEGKSVPDVLPVLPFALTGKHITKKNVEVFDTQMLTVECNEPFPVHGDGEIFGVNIIKIEVSLIPQSLNVAVLQKR